MSTKVSTDLIDLSGNTGGLVWAKGPTTDQPASATAGEMRVDTTTNTVKVHNGTQWKTLKETAFVVPPVPTHFLVIAGGGGGGSYTGGGGGAGGLRTSYGSTTGGGGSAESTTGISLNTAYTITIGEGGAGGPPNAHGNKGINSLFSTITSEGGGYGGGIGSTEGPAGDGGSGGGAGIGTPSAPSPLPGGNAQTSPVQGYNGGAGGTYASPYPGGGGGGAGVIGANAYASGGGDGGNGLSSSITGSSVIYAGGGGGSGSHSGGTPGSGGTGGGGAGGDQAAGENATFNTGSGGGGGGVNNVGGSGGSGVVILRYPTADLPYFTTTGTLNTPSATDTVADTAYPVTNLAYYKLDNNANDSGEGSGYIGQGGIFNGSSSYVSVNSSTALQLLGDYTVSFWFKTNALSGLQRLVNKDNANDYSGGWGLFLYSNGMFGWSHNDGSNNQNWDINAGTISTNTWYNVCAVYSDSNNLRTFYLNGSSVGTIATNTNVAASTDNLFFGTFGASSPSGQYLNGSLDQVRIFPAALSSSNVSLLYAETSATSSTLNYPVTATALYEFSGNADSTSSSAYNGTASNVLYAYNGTATNVTYGNGRFNEAANFNGTSSVIDFSQPLLINTFSVSFWINTLSTASQRILGNPYGGAGDYGWNIRIQATTGHLEVEWSANGTNPIILDTATSVTDGGWHHIVATWDEGSQKIYIDNNEEASSTNASDQYPTTDTFKIGANWNNTEHYNGKIDQVRIFSLALAPGDVEDLYNEHFQTKFTDGSDTALKFTGGTGDITFADTAPVFTPGDNFNTVLYNGNGGTQSITGVDFQPDLVWIKDRDTTGESHRLNDSVRGVGKPIYSNGAFSEGSEGSTGLTAFDSNGFSIGNATAYNNLNKKYVAWSWKAGGAARNNTNGTLTSTISANVDAGFSIVSYTGNLTVSTVGHGLSSAPELIIVKITNDVDDWFVYSEPTGNTKYLNLNSTGAADTNNVWNNTSPTNTVFSLAAQGNVNAPGGSYIAYCFHSVVGYSKISSFVGNGSTVNVVTGFEPAFVMWKNISQGNASYDYWFTVDNKRSPSNPVDKVLYPNDSSAETTTAYTIANFNSNGFDIVGSPGGRVFNNSGDTYIFIAFATNPT